MKKNVENRQYSPRKIIVRLYTCVRDNKLHVRAAIAGEPHAAIGFGQGECRRAPAELG